MGNLNPSPLNFGSAVLRILFWTSFDQKIIFQNGFFLASFTSSSRRKIILKTASSSSAGLDELKKKKPFWKLRSRVLTVIDICTIHIRMCIYIIYIYVYKYNTQNSATLVSAYWFVENKAHMHILCTYGPTCGRRSPAAFFTREYIYIM